MYTFCLRKKANIPNAVISVMLKNECKQWHYFLSEIKDSTHSNEKISRLKQSAKLKTYS